MIRSKGTLNMRQFSLKLAFAGLAGFLVLAGCGGGGSASSSASSVISCELRPAYADGGTSGIEFLTVAQAVNRQFNPCDIRQVQSLTVSVCIAHQQITELSTQLVFPNGTTQNLSIQSVSNTCPSLIGGQLYQATLTSNSLQSLQSLTGNWSVKVTDNNPVTTTIGTLVGWSLRAEGLR
jgi:hypothetical protein